jgi:hypothetical protein
MLVNLQGTITAVGQKRSGVSASTGNAWATQEFVVTDANNQNVCFEVFGEENICKFSAQQQINITCSLSSREYNGRYYTSLRYVVPQTQQNASQPIQQPSQSPHQAPQQFQQAPQQYAQQPTYAQPMQAPQPQFNQSVAAPNTDLPF